MELENKIQGGEKVNKRCIRVVLTEEVLKQLGYQGEVVIKIDVDGLGSNSKEVRKVASKEEIVSSHEIAVACDNLELKKEEVNKNIVDGLSPVAFMEKVINGMRDSGKFRTAANYDAALRRLKEFCSSYKEYKEFTEATTSGWDVVSMEMLRDFEEYLSKRGQKKNTTSFYMRILRAICNRARNEGYNVADGIFKVVYTGKDKTKKRALPASLVRRVANSETKNDKERFARDMFIFSFLTRGMSTIDIAKLTSSNISNKRLTYKRSKTDQQLSMEWLPEMKKILMRWKQVSKDADTPLFPIIKHKGEAGHHDFRLAQQRMNYTLKAFGKRLGLPIPLTMYVARHSWASIAKSGGIPIQVIGDALGHNSESTTLIYLDSISEDKLDQANRKVMRMVKGKRYISTTSVAVL